MSDTATEAKQAPRDVQKHLTLARERFHRAADAEAQVRKDALDDLMFSVGQNQWPSDIVARRTEEGKPVITVNRLQQHILLVTNEQRQQRPSIKVNPVGDGADKDTAEIFQGMVRHIETASESEIAYDTAFDSMVRCGFGVFRVITEFTDPNDPDNFDQELRIEWENDPFRWYFDPSATKPDGSDGKFAFRVTDYTKEEYENVYGEEEAASLADFSSTGDQDKQWLDENKIRVAEYYYVEEKVEVVKSKTGREKKIISQKVRWEKINAVKVLEESEIPCPWIPVVRVLGTSLIIDGKRNLEGLVRNAKGAQRSYNFGISSAWEAAGLAPKSPYICDYRTIVDFKEMWEQANRRNFSALYYNSTPEGVNEPLPAPQRNQVSPDLAAFASLIKQADFDLKSSLGMFDPSLGQNKSDQSGRAIQSLQKQGDLATLNYSDNLSRAIRFLGRILIAMIPHIYDAPRVQRIIQPDGAVDHVGVFNSKKSGALGLDGIRALPEFAKIKKIYDIGIGKYDETVSVGPSYQTKRQEAAASQLELIKTVPQVQVAAPDLIIRNMDIPNADQIADRMKKLLPTALQDDPGDDPKAQLAQTQGQLMQLQQQHAVALQSLQEATETIKGKMVEAQSKERIADMDNKTKITIAEIQTKSQELQTRVEMEKELWSELHGSAHDSALTHIEHAHQRDMADRSQTFEAQQSANAANEGQQSQSLGAEA